MKAVLVAMLALLAISGALAQEQALEGPYRIQPEDVLRILVLPPYENQTISADVPVGRDGRISAPFVGSILVEGKTTSEVESELTQLYIRILRMRDPRVSVTIVRYRPVRASVGGFVQRPGVYEVRPGDTLLTLLNQGGGPVPDRSDLRRATLRRSNSKELIPVDLYAMLIKGDTSQNYRITDGDELTVPEETRNRIVVWGAVFRPGAYPYKEPLFLSDALALAGGEVRYRSMLSKTQIMREKPGHPGQYVRIEADFVKFVRKGDAAQNVQLLPGDFVFVPETKTPDIQQIATVVNSLFFFDRFFREGIFGLRLFR